MTPTPQPGAQPAKKGLTPLVIVLIVLACLGGCCVVGVLAAVAVPNFMRYTARSKQGECKTVLRSIYAAQRAYFEEHQAFAADWQELGHSPDARRYTYFLSAQVTRGPTAEKAVAVPVDALPALAGGAVLGAEGACPDCSLTVACAANLDSDPTLDVWSISTVARGGVPAGQVHQDYDDVADRPGDDGP